MIVMKFGGTSVKDVAAVRRLVDIIRREKRPKLVVVSALSKVTDALIEVGRLAEQGDAEAAAEAVRALHRRHQEMSVAGREPGAAARADRGPGRAVRRALGDRPRARCRRGGLAPIRRHDRGVRRAGQQPDRRRGVRGRGPARPLRRRAAGAGDGRAARRGAAGPGRDRRAAAHARSPARRAGAGAGARRLHRRHHRGPDDDARPGRVGLLGGALRRRARRPRRSRSGPTSTGCSPRTRGSSRAHASSRS